MYCTALGMNQAIMSASEVRPVMTPVTSMVTISRIALTMKPVQVCCSTLLKEVTVAQHSTIGSRSNLLVSN